MKDANMPGGSCPHFGSLADRAHPRPGTSEENACYLGKQPKSVPLLQQEAFCLGERHLNCPRLLRNQGQPVNESVEKERWGRGRRSEKPRLSPLPGVTGVGAVLVVLVVVAVVWLSLRSGGFSFGRLTDSAALADQASPLPTTPPSATQVPLFTATPTSAPTAVALKSRSSTPPTPAASPTMAPATPTPTPTPAGTIYEVQDGDSVYAIAETFGVSVDAIAAANNLADPSRLDIGQKLRIPVAVGGAGSTATSAGQ